MRFSLVVIAALVSPAVAQTVWVTSSLQRTGFNDAPGSATQATVMAAKGETESFQIILRAVNSNLSGVNLVASDLTGPAGTISRSNYSIYAEKYVNVDQSSPDWLGSNRPRGAGWYPDPLIPLTHPTTGAAINVPRTVPAYNNQPFWIDLTVPRTAAAGQYTGTITVQTSAGNREVQVSLTVWNFAIPLKAAAQTSFAFWNYWQVRPDWYAELLKHRVTPLTISNCINQIGTGLVGNGCVADAASERTLMDNMGLYMTALRFWSGAQYGNCITPAAPSVTDIQRAAGTHQSGLLLYNYSFDEITHCENLAAMIPVIQSWARNLHQAGILNHINMGPSTAAWALFNDGTGRSAIDIWGVLPVMYDEFIDGVNHAKSIGNTIWSYNSLVQDSYSPKWQIDFLPIDFRIQPGFINQSLGIKGLLYWRVDRWNSDPWNNVNTVGAWHPTNNYPGDGTLVYPGDQVGIPGGLAPSMRLKWIRDGMDDYDYVEILKGMGQQSFAMSVSNSVGADWKNWTRDHNALNSARNQLGAKIDSLMGGAPSVAAPAPAPAPATGFSITPQTGGGQSGTFTLTYTDAKVPTTYGVHILVSTNGDGRNSCWLWYDRRNNTLSMAWDTIAGWNSNSLGINYTLQNSQCSVNTGSVSAAVSGGTLTLQVPITFKSGFAGVKQVYGDAADSSGSTGYKNTGTWTVQ